MLGTCPFFIERRESKTGVIRTIVSSLRVECKRALILGSFIARWLLECKQALILDSFTARWLWVGGSQRVITQCYFTLNTFNFTRRALTFFLSRVNVPLLVISVFFQIVLFGKNKNLIVILDSTDFTTKKS